MSSGTALDRLLAGAAIWLLATLAPQMAAAAGIQKWIDKNGVTHYSNLPRERAEATRHRVAVTPAERGNRASIYKFKDARGVTHYTDQRPRNRRFVVISVYCPACDPHSPIDWDRTRLNLTAFATSIETAATTHQIDPALVRAIIHAESAFNPQAVSRKGAQGLMQLMPATGDMYGLDDPFDADANIKAGTEHLAMLLKKFNGNVELAAAAYNAGEGAVARYGGVPPYDETRLYVQRVGVLHRRYLSGI
jgi:soluble lytic murein transglycosylase-like protein